MHDPTTRRRKSAPEKNALIEKYLASGLTQKVFCQQEGLVYSTFQLWLKKYRQTHGVQLPMTTQPEKGFIPLVFGTSCADEIPTQVIIEYPNGVVVRVCQPLPTSVLTHLIQLYGG